MTPRPPAPAQSALHARLETLYEQFNHPQSVTDPIQIVRRFSRPDDLEIVAFCAAGLAFGRVQSVLNSIEGLLTVMGPSPAAFVRGFTPARDRPALDHLVHRWTRGIDLAALVWLLKQMLDSHGSIEGFFVHGAEPEAERLTVMQQFWAAYAEPLEDLYQRACALLEEMFCISVNELKVEWHTDYASPRRPSGVRSIRRPRWGDPADSCGPFEGGG